jgi:hypothetical protein
MNGYIKAKYQEWKDGYLVHEYIKFDREQAIANGQEKAVARYDYCLHKFMKETEEQRKKGLIYGGIEFDFFMLEE